MKLLQKNRLGKSILSMGFTIALFAGMSTAAFADSIDHGHDYEQNDNVTAVGTVEHYHHYHHYQHHKHYQHYQQTQQDQTQQIQQSQQPQQTQQTQTQQVQQPKQTQQTQNQQVQQSQPALQQNTNSAVTNSGIGNNIVNTAKSFLGKVTYQFGVRDQSRLILDCSSYTQYVFQLNGIHIPWGSRAQAQVGSYVPRDQLQPGDLVMFSVSTPGQINHVGIYIGNGQFINNLPNRGVVISDMNSSYWNSHYITARRV